MRYHAETRKTQRAAPPPCASAFLCEVDQWICGSGGMQAPHVPLQLSWQVLQVAQLAQVPLQLAPHVHWQLPSQLASGVSTQSGLGQFGYEPHRWKSEYGS